MLAVERHEHKKHEHVQHLILSWGPLDLYDCSNVGQQWLNQPLALLWCYESPSCSDSGPHLFCVVGSGKSNLPRHNNP